MRTSENQIVKNIASILMENPEKIEQLEKVKDITFYCTSDDGIRVIAEMYRHNVVRYLITGTRAKMTVTANAITKELTRKSRTEKPFYTSEITTYCGDILKAI